MSQEPDKKPEIQPADPAARSQALWLILAVTIVLGALVLAVQFKEQQINQWLIARFDKLVGQPEILFLIAFVVMLPLVGVAVHVYRLADQIVKSERIPPPGKKVIKDTPIITGKKAVRQGRGLKFTAVLMGLFGALLPFGLALILMMLQKSI